LELGKCDRNAEFPLRRSFGGDWALRFSELDTTDAAAFVGADMSVRFDLATALRCRQLDGIGGLNAEPSTHNVDDRTELRPDRADPALGRLVKVIAAGLEGARSARPE
jgi:hypothetical protein